ncbi:MAG: histidinol-phosphate transaminase, partial [Candidatus Marinimicrobia bacterium]|nr:histidinol-phosphate transaminase [Candidatus Neomarinimicrobiota bacterium]
MEQQLAGFSFSLETYPGQANFILIKVKDVVALIKFLVQLGVIIRDQSFQTGLEACVRISVGSPRETEKLIQALQEFEVGK